MLTEKFLSINSESENPQDQRMSIVIRFTILILTIHSINTVALYNTSTNFCGECMVVVYVIAGIPLLIYLFKLEYLAKVLFCLMLPISLYFFSIYLGVSYKSEIVYLLFLFLTFYLFNKLIERILISFIYILCYIGIINRINIFNIQPKDDILPEETLVANMIFLGCFGIIFIFCQYFFSTIQSYKLSTTKLLKDLKEQNLKLETANKELERFNYIASHDLKSPLRNITSFINLLERDFDSGKTANIKEYLSFIKKGSNNNQIVFNKLPTIHESPLLIKTVFQNLVENGLKYNDSEHPTVTITYKPLQDGFQIIFKDNGIGMESRYLDQIFEMFKRLHSQTEYEGTGIGLALVKRIVEQLGCSISVISFVGKGTEFRILFPNQCLVTTTDIQQSTNNQPPVISMPATS